MLHPKHNNENIVLKLVFLINKEKNLISRQLLLYIGKKIFKICLESDIEKN